jgi:UDP-N-acetylmuramate dehydrogenase
MQVEQNISLRQFNSFGIDVTARHWAAFQSEEELKELLQVSAKEERLILGGGSNVLFTKDIDGWVLKNEINGIDLIKEDDAFVYVRAGAGVNWHAFVLYCIERNWAGVENLSLIPGNVGASPMQNIGAYGVEIKEVMEELEAYHVQDHTKVLLTSKDCAFGYRESVFKRTYRNQFVILNVTYKLRKQPVFNISYGAIREELEAMGVKDLSIKAISDAVIKIRSSKLPDPKLIGNAGSFFKNPTVSKQRYDELKAQYPLLAGYVNADGTVKLAAGWLIEQCGWKGYRKGDAGCHAKQALVLVNYGTAKGIDVLELSEAIEKSVQEKFGVELEREVNVY